MKKILLTDDDQAFVATLKHYLSSKNYEVVSFSNGKIALTYLENENTDLIITDIVMPHMEGIEYVTKIRNLYPDIPIIAITGANPFYGDLAVKIGADAYLFKPIDYEQLDNMLQSIFD